MTRLAAKLDLCEHWQVSQIEDNQADGSVPDRLVHGAWLTAQVPGAVQYDLIQAGRLENPYSSTKNAYAAAWVARKGLALSDRFQA